MLDLGCLSDIGSHRDTDPAQQLYSLSNGIDQLDLLVEMLIGYIYADCF